jgi:hypothetical protein
VPTVPRGAKTVNVPSCHSRSPGVAARSLNLGITRLASPWHPAGVNKRFRFPYFPIFQPLIVWPLHPQHPAGFPRAFHIRDRSRRYYPSNCMHTGCIALGPRLYAFAQE